jgi:hypothetical protein
MQVSRVREDVIGANRDMESQGRHRLQLQWVVYFSALLRKFQTADDHLLLS